MYAWARLCRLTRFCRRCFFLRSFSISLLTQAVMLGSPATSIVPSASSSEGSSDPVCCGCKFRLHSLLAHQSFDASGEARLKTSSPHLILIQSSSHSPTRRRAHHLPRQGRDPLPPRSTLQPGPFLETPVGESRKLSGEHRNEDTAKASARRGNLRRNEGGSPAKRSAWRLRRRKTPAP